MKDIIITIVIIVAIQFSGNAQHCNINISGFNQDRHVAYLGVENLLIFDATNAVEFETTNCVIFFDGHAYKYKPLFIGKSIVKLFQITGEDKLLIDSCEVDIKFLPFALEVGRHTTYSKDTMKVKKTELLNSYFVLQATNTNISAMAKILEFELLIIRNNKAIFNSRYYNYNKSVDLKLKNDLQIIQADDKIQLKGLKYVYGSNYQCEHKNITIIVK